MPMTPLRLFLALISLLAWLGVTFFLLRSAAPALVSSTDTLLVLIGFALSPVWLIASGCVALHLFQKRRAAASATEKYQ